MVFRVSNTGCLSRAGAVHPRHQLSFRRSVPDRTPAAT
jgi:hypothetical protein